MPHLLRAHRQHRGRSRLHGFLSSEFFIIFRSRPVRRDLHRHTRQHVTAMSPSSPFLAHRTPVRAHRSIWQFHQWGAGVPGVARRVRTVRPRGGPARRPCWSTAQCEGDSEQQISAVVPFWDHDKSIATSSGIAAFFDGIAACSILADPNGTRTQGVLPFSHISCVSFAQIHLIASILVCAEFGRIRQWGTGRGSHQRRRRRHGSATRPALSRSPRRRMVGDATPSIFRGSSTPTTLSETCLRASRSGHVWEFCRCPLCWWWAES